MWKHVLETTMEGTFKISSEEKVLFVGLVCVDLFQVLPKYPTEDLGHKCMDSYWQRGGNASNSSTVFALLNGSANFFGTLADDRELQFIQSDFEKYNINFKNSVVIPDVSCPLSVVILSQETHSRTVLHTNKNLPELTLKHLQQNIDLSMAGYGWIHFEGRDNATEIAKMLHHISEYNENMKRNYPHSKSIITSLEAEKLRFAPGLEKHNMWILPDVMFVSKDFAKNEGYLTMKDAVVGYFSKLKKGAAVICAWGDQGAAAMSSETGVVFTPAFPPEKVVDTCGAGDTFNAATIYGLSKGHTLHQAITFGCKVAGAKCGMQGFTCIKSVIEQFMSEMLADI